ncbi:MAG: hypothetical protein KKA54_09365 [Proteobacteria bacterium]|nr:hypothetical protein [Pseudomonadota bacterium]
MDYRVLAIGVLILFYSLIELSLGKVFVPSWPIFPDEGHITKDKNRELYWLLVLTKVLLGAFLIIAPIYKSVTT